MTGAKSESERLLNEVMPFAEQMLAKHGEFIPFAGAIRPDGQVILIGGYDGQEHPPSKDMIDLLANSLRQGGSAGEYIATALVYDVRVTPPAAEEATDAIAADRASGRLCSDGGLSLRADKRAAEPG